MKRRKRITTNLIFYEVRRRAEKFMLGTSA
jgi:hypothetical protein